MGVVFTKVLPAQPVAPSLVRRAFRRWLSELGWPREQADDLVLALDEAVTNAVEHAYRHFDQHGRVWVLAEQIIDPGGQRRIRLDIADAGRWRPTPDEPGDRGHGLTVMRRCTDSLDIEPSSLGTRVHMTSAPEPGTAPAAPAGRKASASHGRQSRQTLTDAHVHAGSWAPPPGARCHG